MYNAHVVPIYQVIFFPTKMSCLLMLEFFQLFLFLRSLPKLSTQQDDDGTGHSHGPGSAQLFEPIPHDHSFCERVVINVSANDY